MSKLSEEDLQIIADEYYRLWQFPHRIGAIDGKHCKIKCPSNSRSAEEGGTFRYYVSIELLEIENFNIPPPEIVEGTHRSPFVLIGD